MQCKNCGTTHATIYREIDGETLCDGCGTAATNKKKAEANAPSPAQIASDEEHRRRLAEMQAEDAKRPRDPLFCQADQRHRDTNFQAGRPAIAFNSRGELACVECLAKFPPAWLERIAVLEQAMASQPSTNKTVRKAGAQ